MRRAVGIVSLTGLAVAIALATPFDSPLGLAQGRLAAQARQGGAGRAAAARPYTTWQSYAGGAHSSRYSALDHINTKNVAKLAVAWSIPITGNSIFNPVVIDGRSARRVERHPNPLPCRFGTARPPVIVSTINPAGACCLT